MSKNPLSRRQFMQIGSGAVVATTVAKSLVQPRMLFASPRPVAPSDTVRFASIGTGIRGCEHLQASLSVPGITCVAVCDLYDSRHTAAREAVNNPSVAATRDYRSILDRKDVDSVLIATMVARLYWALSRIEPETAGFLRQSIGLQKLVPYAAVLDFYGRALCISGGKVNVPGGTAADPAWSDLVGANPSNPAAFVPRLLAKDKGWLAAYFDVLSRASRGQQAYFTAQHRLKFFYTALLSNDNSEKPTRGTFRPTPEMLLLVTRLPFDSSGEPLVPGGLEAWRQILSEARHRNLLHKWAKTDKLERPDDLVRSMFALSRAPDDSYLELYMALSDLDSRRPTERRLAPATVELLAHRYEDYSDQYRIFCEFPELSDDSITLFLDVAQSLSNVPMRR